MGQYYKPINIENMEWLHAHDFESEGLKLMEHSYVGNKFVGTVMKLMTEGNRWFRKPIVWCGDYFTETGEEGYYDRVNEENKLIPKEWLSLAEQRKAILVNHTTKRYIKFYIPPTKKGEIKGKVVDRLTDNEELDINPLPLLTALGNGRGGGDYSGANEEFVGNWARNVLSVEFEIPKGYEELKVVFKERYTNILGKG